jgi:DNA-binding NarL/FixJ family response regulator
MVVDDQSIVRAGLRAILDASASITVVAEANDAPSALRRLRAGDIDVVLMDLHLPGVSGVEAIRRLREVYPLGTVRVIVLTTFDQDSNVIDTLQAGADGFLSKGVSPRELIAGIEDVAEGGGTLSARAAAALIGRVARTRPPDRLLVARFDLLTSRESEIAALLAEGSSIDAIASDLQLSHWTVKTHLNRAMAKVGVHDRAQLVALATKVGLV